MLVMQTANQIATIKYFRFVLLVLSFSEFWIKFKYKQLIS